jgi:hypothetical protein
VVRNAVAAAEDAGIRRRTAVENGPTLAGYGAEAMKGAIAARVTTMPEQQRRLDKVFRRSIT